MFGQVEIACCFSNNMQDQDEWVMSQKIKWLSIKWDDNWLNGPIKLQGRMDNQREYKYKTFLQLQWTRRENYQFITKFYKYLH